MQFDPTIHTKEFLLSNHDVAFVLAVESTEFAKSDLANDLELLRLSRMHGISLAHWLAMNQPEWIHSDAAKSFEILKLATIDGFTVAHWLAIRQSQWIHSDAAKSFEILKLTNRFGETVAHELAKHQSEWIHSEAAKNPEILKLKSNWCSVAYNLVSYQKDFLFHEPLFHKQILTLEAYDNLLVNEIVANYISEGFDLPVMIMKLISQGAAYKHSLPIDLDVGETIFNQSKMLIQDGSEPLIALKQLQALYSTFSHNVTKIISAQEQITLQKWQGLLLQSENLIRQHLANNPDLYDIEHTIDIHCEPGDDLIKRIQSENSFNLSLLNGLDLDEKDTSKSMQNVF